MMEKLLEKDGESTLNPSRTANSCNKRLAEQVNTLSEQVSQLLAHAEESVDNRKLLWKIDLSVRQLRSDMSNSTNTKSDNQTGTNGPSGMRLPQMPRNGSFRTEK